MTQLLGIVLLTARELWAKKVVLGLVVVSTLVIVMTAFALNLEVVDGTLAGLRIFGAEVDGPPGSGPVESGSGDGNVGAEVVRSALESVVFAVQSVVAGAAYWLGTLLGLFATAPLFTSLVERGHVDLLLAKPMSRTQLLAGHVAAVWLSVLLLAVYLLGGVWLVMSVKSGIWNPRFLLAIGVVTAMFGVMYAVVVFMGVWTQSTALALIVTYGLLFASLVLAPGETLAEQMTRTWRPVYWGFYHVLPNFAEVTTVVARLSQAEAIPSWYPLASSVGFGAALYAGAAVLFARKDF
jgi:ABC-type transport system involved in multi-copper enzyme maturation permease subunit